MMATFPAEVIERMRDSSGTYGHIAALLEDSPSVSFGPLSGTAFAVKDNFAIRGRVTAAGSLLFNENPVAVESAAAVCALEQAGAVPVALTVMDELAHGYTSTNEHSGPVRNPHDPSRLAGGSSGGSAVAVALGEVSLALGTDTNGSIRVPASLCGVIGFKPSFGVIDTAGLVPFAPSLDHVGVLGDDLLALIAAVEVLVGVEHSNSGGYLSVGLADESVLRLAEPEVSDAVRAAISTVRVTDRVPMPWLREGLDAGLTITRAESAALYGELIRRQPERVGQRVRAGILSGLEVTASEWLSAQRVRAEISRTVARLFQRFDVLALPTTPLRAPRIGQERASLSTGEIVSIEPFLGIFTGTFSLLGLPAVSIPVPSEGDLPVGLQLVGRPGGDFQVLEVAGRIQRSFAAVRHG